MRRLKQKSTALKLPGWRISLAWSKTCGWSSVPQPAVCTELFTKAAGILLSEPYSALLCLAWPFKITATLRIMLCKVHANLKQVVFYHKKKKTIKPHNLILLTRMHICFYQDIRRNKSAMSWSCATVKHCEAAIEITGVK